MKLPTAHGEVSFALDGPPDAPVSVVLAHGAGAGYNGDFLRAIARDLAGRGHQVARFNFPYAERGRKAPDRQPVLERTWADVLDQITRDVEGRLIIGGKSMGGRIASMVAAAGRPCDGLLFLGYPLHPPGRPDRLRVEHLGDVRVPMLFVTGTRDPLCSLDLLEQTVAQLGDRARIARIQDGDHSFRVRRSSRRSTHDAWTEVCNQAHTWIWELML
jgi:predicted alpha/beta-hydrolase family hydrolase